MKLEILGTGCPKCKKLFEVASEAVKEAGVVVEIVKVDKINDIMNYGVMITPALAIDGNVVSAGKIPSKEEIKNWITKGLVKQEYTKIAKENSCCCSKGGSCCGSKSAGDISKNIGYAQSDITAVPEGSNLGLGCGNPLAMASLKEGETVLDLGSGAGFDCFLAASRVGEKGRVIGVDMTPEMVQKAENNLKKSPHKNIEFWLGEIEKLPVQDNYVDVVISNCVINLSPDKAIVFKEAYRVLKPGGRVMLSDIVLLKELPKELKESQQAYTGCVSGAIMKDEYLRLVQNAGFVEVKIMEETTAGIEHIAGTEGLVASIKLSALKPKIGGLR